MRQIVSEILAQLFSDNAIQILLNLTWVQTGTIIYLRYGKTGNKKRATCLAKLLQNKLNSDVARFTTHIEPVLQQIGLLIGLNEDDGDERGETSAARRLGLFCI